ncbi:MAG: choice-of-anchor D domain-containing protein, partial [Marinoscillum sp.]
MDSRPYSVGPQQQFAIDFDPSPILADFNQNPISIYQKVDNNFELQKRIYQSPDSPLISTYGLVIDADGNVLTYNFKDQRLYQVSKNGIRPISQKKQLLAIAYDHQDRLWALRQSNDSLLLGPVNTQTLQFTSSPLSLAISRDCFQGPISATEDYINCNLPTNGLTFDPISYDPWISSTSGDIYHISLTDSSVESQIKVTSVLRDSNFDLNGNLYGVLSGLKPNSNFYSTDYISIDKSTGQIEFINNTNGNLWSIETSPAKNSEIRFSKTIDASKIYQRDTSSVESFVWVTNESPNDLIIESSTVDSIVSIDPSLFPVSIAPNTTHQFPLSINPNVAHQGFFLSPLSFQSNDSLFSAKTIAVFGEVLPPLSLPDSLDMGVVPTIESGTYEILVQNHGDQAITIESIESDIAETDPIEVIAELPRTLNPGENYTITLNFSPNSTASYAKTIQLITSDQINPEIKINGESIIPIDSWTTCYESWLCDLGIVGESFPFSLSISNVLDQLVTIDSITSTGPFSVNEHGIINIHPYKFLNLDLFFWEPVESGQNSGSIILHFGNHQIHIPIWANAVDAFTVERNKVFGLSYSVDTTNSVVAYNLMSIDDGFNIQLNQESFNHYSFKSSCIDEKGRIYGIGDKRLYRTNGNSVYRKIPLNGISSPRISAAAFNHSDNKFYVYSEGGGLYVENREDRTFEYLGKATDRSIELYGGKVVSMVVNPSNEHLVLFYMDGQDEKYHILEFDPNNLSDRTNRMLENIYSELTDIFYDKHNTLFGLSGQIVVNLDAECPTSLKHLSEPLHRIIYSSNSVNIDFEVSQSDDFIFTLDENDLASGEYIYFLNGNGIAL